MDRRILQGGVALAAAFVLVGWMTRDTRLKSSMVGRWRCAPYYSGTEATIYFLGNGRFAVFEKIGDLKSFETGSWDVVDGEMIEIIDHGDSVQDSATWTRVRLDWTTLRFGEGKAVCTRIEAD